MSESVSTPPPRGQFWVSFLAVLGCFAIFLVIVAVAYLGQRPKAIEAMVETADGSKITATENRVRARKTVEGAAAQADSYAVIDAQNGAVRLKLERAMALVVKEQRAAQQKAAPAAP